MTPVSGRIAAAVGLALAAGLLGACASGQLTAAGGMTGDGVQAPAASGSAFPAAPGGAGANAEEPFNPFKPPGEGAAGQRQVILQPSLEEVLQTGSLPEMSLGRADAPVVVVKYASLTCPYCRKFQAEVFPKLKRAYIDTGKVRFILREFPIGRASGNATIALRCASPDKYFTLYGKFLEQQARWVSQEVRLDAIHSVAREVGLSRNDFDRCLENRSMIGGLEWVKDRGRTLGIIGTPNFFIDQTLIKKVLTYEELATLIDERLAARRGVAEAQRKS
ncbi:MAG: DsbA family protein [Hyphomicrobiaceae bacterium]|nr:DsbA family protein [Hyphomicrobiaceae bacterium]